MCLHGYVNYISNGLTEKMVNKLGLNFFPQTLLLRKVLEFPYEN